MVSTEIVKFSFYVPYVLLVTTGTICFIEAIRTPTPYIRHIFNIETCISVIAAFMYGELTKLSNKDVIDFPAITKLRYTDWFITTPLMIFGLSLAVAYNNKTNVRLSTLLSAIAFNFVMLYAGYLGELGVITRKVALVIGFIAYFALFFILWEALVKNSRIVDNYYIFGAFMVFWALYGVAYMAEEKTKNISFNALDSLSKCFVGIFFWIYFTKVVVL